MSLLKNWKKTAQLLTPRPTWFEKSVPCGGCTECCKNDAIYMHPEMGDRAADYLTEEYEGRTILQHKENGDCVYLEKLGCSIWDRRPGICKELDCAVWLDVRRFPKADMQEMLAAGVMSHHKLRAAALRKCR